MQSSLFFQADTNLYAGSELPELTSAPAPMSKPADFSFEDFLKQLETENLDKKLAPSAMQDQDKELTNQDKFSEQATPSPFLFDLPKRTKPDNQGKKLEQEIINIFNQKITPLANDLSKIVQGPDAKKALEEKKKQREQEEKDAARRIEQMKLKRPSGYSPSYRPSSYGGRDWSPSSSRGRSGGYGSGGYGGYSGYSPSSSYWDRYKEDDSLKNKDLDKTLTTGKDNEKEKSTSSGKGNSKADKESKKAIAHIDNLTSQIQAILAQENTKIGNTAAIQELATGETLIELKKLFDERQNELAKGPENQPDVTRNVKTKRSIKKNQRLKKHSASEYKIKNLEQEKVMWEKFVPQIVSAIKFESGTEKMTEAQKAGRNLLSALKRHKYIPESAGKIQDEIKNKEDIAKGEKPAAEKKDE